MKNKKISGTGCNTCNDDNDSGFLLLQLQQKQKLQQRKKLQQRQNLRQKPQQRLKLQMRRKQKLQGMQIPRQQKQQIPSPRRQPWK